MPTDKEDLKKAEAAVPSAQAAQGAPDNNCAEQKMSSCGCGCIMTPVEKE